MTGRVPPPLADRCEICGRPLISRRVRQRGRCGVHPRQPAIPPTPATNDEGAPR